MTNNYKTVSMKEAVDAVFNEEEAFMLIRLDKYLTVEDLAQADAFVMKVTDQDTRFEEILDSVDEQKPMPSKKKAKQEPKLDHGKIVALAKAGWSQAKIAGEMGCSIQAVSWHLKKEGL